MEAPGHRRTRGEHALGALIAILFFAWQVPAVRERGVTWDEKETQVAGNTNLHILKALFTGRLNAQVLRTLEERAAAGRIFHELPGYNFVGDTLRAGFAALLRARWGWSFPTAAHCFHTVLSALSLYLLFRLALTLSHSRLLALFCALALALWPKFIGHSQNNPKDLPALFCFVLAMHGAVCMLERGGVRRALLAGAALGLAVTHGPICSNVLLILVVALAVIWRATFRTRWLEIALFLISGAFATVLCWPWLWPNPASNLKRALQQVGSFGYANPLLYLGKIHDWTSTPWHYSLVALLTSTPLPLLLWAAIGGITVLLADARTRRLVFLGLIWTVTLLVADLFAPCHYDGMRHLLALLPGLCLVVGGGLGVVQHWLRRRPLVFTLLALASGGHLLWVATTMRPYEDAYLNEMTNAMIDGPSEDCFELEYWGCSYPEGARWLNTHAEPDAQVFLPWTLQASEYLERKASLRTNLAFFDTTSPRYLMFVTRKAFYDRFIVDVEARYLPVFTVQRQKGTLLKIYKNTLKRTP
ncbi:MAG: hypothetical protein U1E76_21110 [Planctomycetota bacterium]